MVSEPLQKTFLREKSELKLREKEEVVIACTLLSAMHFKSPTFETLTSFSAVQEKAEGSRRLTTVISPGRQLLDYTKVLLLILVLRGYELSM